MITAHVLIKNEENFLWYSVSSVINFIDEVKIWDTGSTDSTKEIALELKRKYSNKIQYKEVGNVDKYEYSKVRQQMLDETKNGWVFILDGDEIWWDENIKKVVDEINKNGDKYESIVVPTVNVVGDMFHIQDEKAGQYKLVGRKGHLALRFLNRNIPGLRVNDVYGKEGFTDGNGKLIQDRDKNKILFLDSPYIHTTHLVRSSKDNEVMQRGKKLKYEIGISLPSDYYYPETFFRERPLIVPNIWTNMNNGFRLRAFFETPARKIWRKLRWII